MRPALGRIWAILYLSKHPIDADALREQLEISAGALNTGLRELVELGLVQRETVSGEKKFYYRAQKEMWLLLTRIFRERERERVLDTLGKIRDAETVLLNLGEVSDGGDVAHRLEHIQHLMKLGDFVVDVLDARIASAVRAQLPLPDPVLRLQRIAGVLPAGTPLLIPPVLVEIR